MEKIIDFIEFIWWVLAIAILPLQGYFIMDCIAKNNFNFIFWFVTIIYILLCIIVGARLYLLEAGRDN